MTAKSAKTPSNLKARRSHNRVQPLLDAAAKSFADKGYKETTMRDISAPIGMLPGSVYYHFKSKKELLLAVYEQAVSGIKDKIQQAISTETDPWKKLEAAVVTHVETILDQSDYARVMVGVHPSRTPDIQNELTAMRDSYEKIFVDLIAALPLKQDVDKTLIRLMLLGAVNAAQGWYQKGRDKPERIGREFVRYLRDAVYC